MKATASIVCVLFSIATFAQNRANIWQLGYNLLYATKPTFGINFNSGVADTFTLHRQMQMFITGAGICDTSGQLLFYTNGVWIANRNNDSLLNGSGFNPGLWTDIYGSGGLGFSQAAIAIPKPGAPDKYLLFYVTAEDIVAYGQGDVQPLHLSCSEVYMQLDDGLGGIVEGKKNIHVIEDTLSQGRITACKHANGRDWWVLIHKYYSNIYYKVLVTPDTMIVTQQAIGNKFTSNDIQGMAGFSPDGTKYCQVNINDTIDLLDFDRCKGELSNPRTLVVSKHGTQSASDGCSFSPNSRYLYVTSLLALWQFDTWNSNIDSSQILVDTVPYLQSANYLFINQLAPDNKIYMATWSSDALAPVLHLINSPDSFGKECHFEFSGFALPPVTANGLVPNFPNYDLGPLQGSGCDTIITSSQTLHNAIANYKVNPNPATSWINIVYNSNEDALFELYDLYGRKVAAISLFRYFKNRLLNVSNLENGMYEWRVKGNGEILSSGKVAVIK